MRNIRLTLEYDGTDYVGWQMQDNGLAVQEVVTTALEALTGHPITLYGSGRTDSGVHAEGQNANFFTNSNAPLRAYVMGLNAMLPDDITVSSAALMSSGFDSRRDARGKTYRYIILNTATPSALWRRWSWWVFRPLDSEAMARVGAQLVGIHDFSAFRSARCDSTQAVRRIDSLTVERKGDFVELTVRGSGFLRNMVRIIAGTLMEAGLGKLDEDDVKAAFETGDRELIGITAPAQGLALVSVAYDEEPSESYP